MAKVETRKVWIALDNSEHPDFDTCNAHDKRIRAQALEGLSPHDVDAILTRRDVHRADILEDIGHDLHRLRLQQKQYRRQAPDPNRPRRPRSPRRQAA